MKEQKPVPHKQLYFVSNATTDNVAKVLVLPVYESFHGLSTKLGEGEGRGHYHTFIKRPFFYTNESSFQPVIPRSIGIFWIPWSAFTGRGCSLEGYLIVAPHYAPFYLWDIYNNLEDQSNIPLKPLSIEESDSMLIQFKNAVNINEISGNSSSFWDLPGKEPITLIFSDKERKEILAFIESSIITNK